jgi:hypothetical protein
MAGPQWTFLIVGGNSDILRGVEGRLNKFGIEVGSHWEMPRDVKSSIPKKCNAIMVLKDFVSHPLAERARLVADKTGIPCCITTRKWVGMSQALSTMGFIKSVDLTTEPLEAADEEETEMSKPNLSVNVQTVPAAPAAPAKKTRAELIESLKLTALELLSDHHVITIQISEQAGIQIQVMEQLNVKL